jgi:hypothetical protein
MPEPETGNEAKEKSAGNGEVDRPTSRPKVHVPKPESKSRVSKFFRRAPATPIDEGDEDVNEFISGLIKKVDKSLKK